MNQTINKKEQLEIQDEFQNLANKSDFSEVLKELFNNEKISMIGDLTKEEIKLITRIEMLADIKDIDIWKKGIQTYQRLLLSKNRLSRKEIINAIKGNNSQMGGLMSKMNPMNWGRG